MRLTYYLVNDTARRLASAACLTALDGYVMRLTEPKRKDAQNDKMHAMIGDIAEQAYIEGRTYSDKVWYEFFKELYLPEIDDPELVRLVKDVATYRKWDTSPSGKRVLVGSTTWLSIRGFALYLKSVELHGESMGVMFHTRRT